MTSSTITGDRRWASARRGGMTVLGKVAVPKPINLPSQRLENHGLDPNVEIVPKGTLSWGSRPSSSGSNAWGTSALSPTTDGSSSSPRQLVGRPSSSGGTRPSTAGSDRAHDSNGNTWGSSSRPSSSSGVLASNHASSVSLRPRSADTRPGSSHLSRFAEPALEGPGVWGTNSTSEQVGVASSANEEFSLTSGDFPTLGSEKDESNTDMEPLDRASHGRPGSSGGTRTMTDGRGIAHGDDISRNSDVKGNSWRNDGPPFVEDGPWPNMERWHGEPHLYPNPNMAPHYESWRGAPPVNPPGGGWYRGPPGPPPYGGPVPPGGFPMEPYPYYHPQVPAPGLAGSQPMPPGAGHHGHRPKNGDMPHMPHVPHLHPGMPMRPGFYPGPVHYDGYYRPPMGFCNPNERDLPFMGMPAGPPIYNRHPNQNAPDQNNAHPRSREGRGPEQVEPGHPHDPRGHFKVLGHPNDSWTQNEEEKWGHRGTITREKGTLSKAPVQENAWEDDYKKDEGVHYGKSATKEVASRFDNKFTSNPSSGKFPECLSNIDETQISPTMENVVSPQDHSLIQKIEGLNAKTRSTGRKEEGFHREGPNDRVQMINAKDYRSANEANSDVVLERHHPTGVLVPVSRSKDASAADRSRESSDAPRRSVRGPQSRGNSHAKGGFHGQDADRWGKKSDSQSVEAASRSVTDDQVEQHNAAVHTAEPSRTNVKAKGDAESKVSSIDPSDMQRAKMREIAKQRSIQLQKEEEERVREQKAKALAKLEELNRRSANQGVENPNQREPIPPPGDVPKKEDVSRNQSDSSVDANHGTGSSSASPNNVAQINERSASKIMDSVLSSSHLVAETKRSAYQEASFSSQNQLPTADVNVDDDASHRTAPQVREVSKQKRGGQKQRQSVPPEKNPVQDTIPAGITDVLKDLKVASTTREVTGSSVDSGVGKEHAESPITAELPVQKKKINKSGKNRHKVEESSTAVSSPVTQPKDSNLAQAIPKSAEQNCSSLPVNSLPMQLSADLKDVIQSSENHTSLSREDTHGRVNSTWKAQHSRKPRNSQSNKSSEKPHNNDAVVWAPVRPHSKLEVTDQTSQKAAEPLVSPATGDSLVLNSSKTKRAEMERYVPKPVAKELAQQGSIQQPLSPSIDPAETDGSGGRDRASHGSEYAMKAGASVESKHVDGKNRHQKAQGSWRQRASAKSTLVQASQDSSAANTGKNIQTNGSQLTVRSDESLVRGPPSKPDEHSEKGPQTSISDGWESVTDSTSNPLTGAKDHIPTGKGKRHPFKGQKGGGSHQTHDHKDSNAGLTDLQYSHVEANQTDKTMASKDNRAAGDRPVPHWQPKSQGYVAHNQQGNRSRGSQNIIPEEKEPLKSETGPKGAGEAMPRTGHQEAKRDKRVAVKRHPQSPIQEPQASPAEVEPALFGGLDGRNEQRPSSGYRKNANFSGRSNRGHESHGDWGTTAQENKQHFSSANNRERQRQNTHYEYQPVGPYNGSSKSNEPGVQTENQSAAPRFRERGPSHSRRGRGNFDGRQSGNE
ncbi:protein MODIFIER OF SNC1 1 isoform X2 [Spinacia oleracea]|uniref:Protein MODIFIER OF SNC1 1 isoform X2 n=1 Tax=Spinacia oleracea TaxID=3562 RepID=A0ABM3QLE4_SPIOL|nr:protein MODIFIER OF SNC1 1 isoform X2 [Spinacia oleracea]